MLNKLKNTSVVAILSVLITFFGVGFETIEACCQCLHTDPLLLLMHEECTQSGLPEHEEACPLDQHCSGGECACPCQTSGEEGCKTEVTLHSLGDCTVATQPELLPPFSLPLVISNFWAAPGVGFPQSVTPASPHIFSSSPPIPSSGRATLGLICILRI